MSKTTVIYHRADYDGLFSAAVCSKFLPDAELIGWDFGDTLVPLPLEGDVYIVDLSPDCLEGSSDYVQAFTRLIWIDHHKSSIDKYAEAPPFKGYRIDGVAACRLCWAWFMAEHNDPVHGMLATKTEFVNRQVKEPLALTLAGEYDVWDKSDERADPFQFGLTANRETIESLKCLLDLSEPNHSTHVAELVDIGKKCMSWQRIFASQVMRERSYRRDWEGHRFAILGSAHTRNSMWFPENEIEPEVTALMCWRYDGNQVAFSLYHAPAHEEHDLSTIAVKYGGGGHRGACGFSLSLDAALEIIR